MACLEILIPVTVDNFVDFISVPDIDESTRDERFDVGSTVWEFFTYSGTVFAFNLIQLVFV